MIKSLIFDFGKVLVDYDFFHTIRRYFDSDEDLHEFGQLFTSAEFLDRCDKEVEPFEEIIRDSQRRYPKFEYQLQKFYDEYTQFVFAEIPGMRELLQRLHAEGFGLYGLTNWCSMVHKVMAQWDIFKLLDGQVISSEEKLIKPEPAIYLRLCEKYGLRPEECVFTDDKAVNIEGAIRTGMQGILFLNAEQYERELRKLLAAQ